jgi:hypothetical protein
VADPTAIYGAVTGTLGLALAALGQARAVRIRLEVTYGLAVQWNFETGTILRASAVVSVFNSSQRRVEIGARGVFIGRTRVDFLGDLDSDGPKERVFRLPSDESNAWYAPLASLAALVTDSEQATLVPFVQVRNKTYRGLPRYVLGGPGFFAPGVVGPQLEQLRALGNSTEPVRISPSIVGVLTVEPHVESVAAALALHAAAQDLAASKRQGRLFDAD